jgi:hypothetical protein
MMISLVFTRYLKNTAAPTAVRLIADEAVASLQSAAAGSDSAGASTAAYGQQQIADRTNRMLLESAKLQHAEVCVFASWTWPV